MAGPVVVVSRLSDRGNLPEGTRIAWLEQDVDYIERHLKEEITELRADVDQLKRNVNLTLVTLIGVLGALAANLIAAAR